MQVLKITVKTAEGLHARPATLFCSLAGSFSSDIQIKNLNRDSEFVNAKSILKVLTLGVSKGHEIEVQAEGEDEESAIEAIKALVETNFPKD